MSTLASNTSSQLFLARKRILHVHVGFKHIITFVSGAEAYIACPCWHQTRHHICFWRGIIYCMSTLASNTSSQLFLARKCMLHVHVGFKHVITFVSSAEAYIACPCWLQTCHHICFWRRSVYCMSMLASNMSSHLFPALKRILHDHFNIEHVITFVSGAEAYIACPCWYQTRHHICFWCGSVYCMSTLASNTSSQLFLARKRIFHVHFGIKHVITFVSGAEAYISCPLWHQTRHHNCFWRGSVCCMSTLASNTSSHLFLARKHILHVHVGFKHVITIVFGAEAYISCPLWHQTRHHICF